MFPNKHATFFRVGGVIFDVFLLSFKYHKVFWSVIVLISVNVMNDLATHQRASKHSLCDNAVFVTSAPFGVCVRFTFTAPCFFAVAFFDSSFFAPARACVKRIFVFVVPSTTALARAKIAFCSFNVARRFIKWYSTILAVNVRNVRLTHRHLPTSAASVRNGGSNCD